MQRGDRAFRLHAGFSLHSRRRRVAWLLSGPAGLGPLGVYIAVPVSFTALTVWSAVLFRRGKWKEKQV